MNFHLGPREIISPVFPQWLWVPILNDKKKKPSYSPASRKLYPHLHPASGAAVVKQKPSVKTRGKAHSSLISEGSFQLLPCPEDCEATLSSLMCWQAPGALKGQRTI